MASADYRRKWWLVIVVTIGALIDQIAPDY
jgi:hypothetical protein